MEKVDDFQNEDDIIGLGCALEVFKEHEEVLDMIENVKSLNYTNRSLPERAYEKFLYILGQYQEQPHLLDKHIDSILQKFVNIIRDKEIQMHIKHEIFKYMHVLINVRGYKVIIRHLPHEVADFEPVMKLLEAQDITDSETWTTRYVLLLWLSIIVIIPFHMSRFDGFSTNQEKKPTVTRILDICKTYIVVSDKCRDAASYLVSQFLTRADVKDEHMSTFFNWTCEVSTAETSTVFVKYGSLSSIAMVLKHGKREDLLPHSRKLLQWIINAEFKNFPGTNIQKLVYKVIYRIGLTLLPARVMKWRYQRGNRSLADNLSAGDGCISDATQITSADNASDLEDEDIDVPEEVEEVIDELIQGLRSGDGVVRWSAAKGIGRVTGRLPKDLADEVVGSILELFNPREGDGAWHGGCLALAELGRRGLLLPQRLPAVVPVILKALVYDEPRGYSSVGSHIRDSACYVCWSFARAYDTEVLAPYVQNIASTLIIVAVFDREINCRRAASAAFQENVGRQGTFPHGIDILTAADFFSVSVRNNAYLDISVYVAQFEEYTLELIDHLLNRKVDHWDICIRELTAKALHNLTAMAPEYMFNIVLPALFVKTASIDLNARHGAVISIGEILHALSKKAAVENIPIEKYLGENLLNKSRDLIKDIRERLHYRGMGGELMKQASSNFIEKCSLAHMPFHNGPVIEDWLTLLTECLSYDVPVIRTNAVSAFPALLNEYFRGDSQDAKEQQMRIINRFIDQLKCNNNQVARMGNALALGSMPGFMFSGRTDLILNSLIDAATVSEATLKWAESRRDAIKALTSVCVTLEDSLGVEVKQELMENIYNCLFNGLTEYTQDNRGDIGAWVREVSMVGLRTLTALVAKNRPEMLTASIVKDTMAGIAQQAVEKIDRTRGLAGRLFFTLIYNDPIIPHISNRDEVLLIFPKEECDIFNWNSEIATFPKFVQLISFPDYRYKLMLGMIVSVGGLTENLVKCSSAAMFAYLKQLLDQKGPNEIVTFCDVILRIFVDYQKNNRITVAMFRFLDKLFSSGCIQCVIDDPQSQFPFKTLKLIQSEIAGCKDIYKLIDGIDVLCQFVQVKGVVCNTTLVQLCILLCHRQTYVRKSTSNKLYEALLLYGEVSSVPEETLDEAMSLLSESNWEESVEVVKPIRNNLCALLGVRVPVPKQKPTAAQP